MKLAHRGPVMRSSRSKSRPNVWLFFLSLAAIPLLAQQDTGVIAGTVLDPGGSVVPQVAVKIINTGTNLAVELATDQERRLHIASAENRNLPP